MKTLLFAFCFLASTACFGQAVAGAASLSNEAVPLQIVSHPRIATFQAMATTRNLLEKTAPVAAQGERPLWEVAPKRVEIPLGDIARDLRKEKAEGKKATFVRED